MSNEKELDPWACMRCFYWVSEDGEQRASGHCDIERSPHFKHNCPQMAEGNRLFATADTKVIQPKKEDTYPGGVDVNVRPPAPTTIRIESPKNPTPIDITLNRLESKLDRVLKILYRMGER